MKLTNLADRQHEYAYQTVVEINGHVFKGILYDQGLDIRPTSSHLAPLVNVQPELQLGSTSSAPLVDFDGLYGSGNHAHSFHNTHYFSRKLQKHLCIPFEEQLGYTICYSEMVTINSPYALSIKNRENNINEFNNLEYAKGPQ